MSRYLLVAAICGALSLMAGPLHAATKVQVETHRSEAPVDVKQKRPQPSDKGVGISFAASARVAADGTIEYKCVEVHGTEGRQGKPHFHEEL